MTIFAGACIGNWSFFLSININLKKQTTLKKTDGEIIFVGIKKKGLKIPNW